MDDVPSRWKSDYLQQAHIQYVKISLQLFDLLLLVLEPQEMPLECWHTSSIPNFPISTNDDLGANVLTRLQLCDGEILVHNLLLIMSSVWTEEPQLLNDQP